MTKALVISKPRPLFRRQLRLAPAHPLGARVLVREFPVESKSEGGVDTPDIAKERYFAGTLIAAGDQAADRLYDLGVEPGDEVWYGKYAGLVQEWQHIVGADRPACPHDGAWDFVPSTDKAWSLIGTPNENMRLRRCRGCETLKLAERVIVLSVDDICLDVDLELRLESGEMVRKRGKDGEGRTRYYVERTGAPSDELMDRFESDTWQEAA